MSIQKLTSKIKRIVKEKGLSESESIRLSLYTFIDFSLLISAQAVCCRQKEKLSMKRIFDNSLHKNLEIRMDKLLEATQLYFSLVKEHPPFTDLISMVYEELAITDGQAKQFGQYFTPPDIARALAHLLAADSVSSDFESLPITIGDPCSGSGSLVMAQLELIHQHSPEMLKYISVIVNDVDEKPLRACCLQILANMGEHKLSLHSITAVISNVITNYTTGGELFMEYKGITKIINEMLKLETIL
jgi:type I restriction-modification system DNA methylase subunit